MSTSSNIEWTDATWNPVTGCTRVSAGCDRCYAVTMTHRIAGMEAKRGLDERTGKYVGLTVVNPRGERHFNGKVRYHADALEIPLRWRKPRRVFVNSMSDLFHKSVPFEFVDRVFAVMALTPRHTYQVLTKRPERMAEYFAAFDRDRLWRSIGAVLDQTAFTKGGAVLPHKGAEDSEWWDDSGPLPNVWLGTSVENQVRADERISHLLRCPAAVRFLSCEPMLGELDIGRALALANYTRCLPTSSEPARGIDWVIVGCESLGGTRVGRLGAFADEAAWWDGARRVRDQCRDAGVAFFMKQGPDCGRVVHELGAMPADLRVREWPAAAREAVRA